MVVSEPLVLLGSPDVRNAILLNEIGVLIHDLGKLSEEYVSGGAAFPHHLILRRLTRGKDPHLESDPRLPQAVVGGLRASLLSDEGRAIVALLEKKMDLQEGGKRPTIASSGNILDEALCAVGDSSTAGQREIFELPSEQARDHLADLEWQIKKEEALAILDPPMIAVTAFCDGLDKLPFVADLVEMQGRTWHPEWMLPPEVRLLRAIHEADVDHGVPERDCSAAHLAGVRQICCEVLANHLLEINNIRKDGPGDLGSWFWRSRFYPQTEEAMTQLAAFDRGAELSAEAMDAVRWLGVRTILQWAYSKVTVGTSANGRRKSLWEHSRTLSDLYKSGVAGAILVGRWPEFDSLAWARLEIGLTQPQPGDFDRIRELIEVEYPLGNELRRSRAAIQFTFPELAGEMAACLIEDLESEITSIVGGGTQLQIALDRSLSIPV